jgi:hypothetical protein
MNDSNWRMMASNHRQTFRCSLCGVEGRRATGAHCLVVASLKAPLIPSNEVRDIAERVRIPDNYRVKQPDQDTRQLILQWFSRRGSNALLPAAFHLVLLNTYFGATANLHYKHNYLIEVTTNEERNCQVLKSCTSPPIRFGNGCKCIVRRNREKTLLVYLAEADG